MTRSLTLWPAGGIGAPILNDGDVVVVVVVVVVYDGDEQVDTISTADSAGSNGQ